MKTRTWKRTLGLAIAASLFLFAGAMMAKAAETPQTRLSTSSQGQGIERGRVGDGVVSHDELEALVTSGSRDGTTRGSAQQATNTKSDTAVASSPLALVNEEFWFFDVTVDLFADLDRDGFYTGLDVAFDVDTIYTVADVYAVIYLSYEFGPWNEYAVTEDFTIFGASGGDEYVVETDLVSGYPTGEYDILIELFDADDGTFVASIGPEDTSELAYLPLEDIGRDTPPGTTTVVVTEGGGAFGLAGLLALAGVVGWRRASRRFRQC